MHPVLIKLGPITLHCYGLMIAIGFLAALQLTLRWSKAEGIDTRVVADGAFWCLVLGIAGTRILHIIMFPADYSWRDPIGWIAIWRGGLVFQGALVLPVIYALYATRKHKIPFWKMTDIAIPTVPLAHASGRIGCFLNGCCYGERTDVPWGIAFPRIPSDLSQMATGSPAYLDHCRQYSELSISHDLWSYPVHPTQLYSAIMLIGIFSLLVLLRKKWHPFEGSIFALYFIFYGMGRFVVEFFRGDHNPTWFGGLVSQQQVFSILFAAAGALIFILLYRWHAHTAKKKA